MKIALVNQPWDGSLPPQSSLSIWTYEMAQRLGRRCDVVVYGRKQPGQPDEEQIAGVRYRHVTPIGWPRFHRLRQCLGFIPKATFTSPWFHLGYAVRVARELAREQFHLVHVFNLAQFVPVFRQLTSARIVLNMQSEWLSQLDRRMNRRRLRRVDMICGCSDYITNKIKAAFPEYAQRCRTLYNGVDTCRFQPRPSSQPEQLDRQNVLFVGRVSPEKGIHVLIDAFAIVAGQEPRARMTIVGPDAACPAAYIVELSAGNPQLSGLMRFYGQHSYLEQLRQQVRSLGLEDRIHFTGPLSHDDAPQAYRQSDLLVNPSFSESFGMSLVEAMSSGLPVIGTRVGGMEELVEQSGAGMLSPAGDEQELARCMLCLLRNRQGAQEMGERGRQWVAGTCCWERLAERFLGFCRELMTGQAGEDNAFLVSTDDAVAGPTSSPPDPSGRVESFGDGVRTPSGR